jgi:hypothetical protein
VEIREHPDEELKIIADTDAIAVPLTACSLAKDE